VNGSEVLRKRRLSKVRLNVNVDVNVNENVNAKKGEEGWMVKVMVMVAGRRRKEGV
jgi:hypothetical protein